MMNFYGTQPIIPGNSPFVIDFYKTGYVVPGARGTLSVPVIDSSAVRHGNSGAVAKSEKKSNLGAVLLGITGIAAIGAMAFGPTRKWAKKTFSELGEKVGSGIFKNGSKSANKKATKAVSDILDESVETTTKKIKNKGLKGTVIHCAGKGKSATPITFTSEQIKHLTPVEGKQGVYKVLVGKTDDGIEEFAEMTLKKGKIKGGKEAHFVTDVKKITPSEVEVPKTPASQPVVQQTAQHQDDLTQNAEQLPHDQQS